MVWALCLASKTEESARIMTQHARAVAGIRQPSRQWREHVRIGWAPGHVDERPIRSPDAASHAECLEKLVDVRVQIVEALDHARDAKQRRKLRDRNAFAAERKHGLEPRVTRADGDIAHAEMI